MTHTEKPSARTVPRKRVVRLNADTYPVEPQEVLKFTPWPYVSHV